MTEKQYMKIRIEALSRTLHDLITKEYAQGDVGRWIAAQSVLNYGILEPEDKAEIAKELQEINNQFSQPFRCCPKDEDGEDDDPMEWINENQSRLLTLPAMLVNFHNLLHKHEAFYKAISEIRRLCDRALAEYGDCEPEFGGGYSFYQWSISRKVGGKMPDEERLVGEAGRRVEVAEGDGLGDLGEPGVEGAEVPPSVEGSSVHSGDYSKGGAGAQAQEQDP